MKAPMWSAALCLGMVAAACSGRSDGAANDSGIVADTGASVPAPASGAAPAVSSLERAARQVAGFLSADVPFDSLALADTVELRIAPEGGGATRRVPREALRDREAWTIGEGARRVRLIPAAGNDVIAAAEGRHYRCQAQMLAPLAPDWAERPHVGVRRQPDSAASCLQSWNATFVFDTTQGEPRLTGVLYDQWEW